MKVLKKDVDDFIRIVRKYYNTSDEDLLAKMHEVKEYCKQKYKMSWEKVDIIGTLARLSRFTVSGYQVVYDCLKIFGFEIVEEE